MTYNHTHWHLLLLLLNYFSFYFSSDFSSVQEAIHWQCSMHTGYVFCGTLIWYMPSLCMHVLIVLLSLLCTLPTPTVLFEYTQLQLGCIDTDFYLHACEQLHAVKHPVCMKLQQSPPRHQHFSALIQNCFVYWMSNTFWWHIKLIQRLYRHPALITQSCIPSYHYYTQEYIRKSI